MENTNRHDTFLSIFSSQNDENGDEKSIARQLQNVNNYNTMTSEHIRTNSMETVWAYDMTEPKSPTSKSAINEFGIPTMLKTTHMMQDDYDPYEFANADKPTPFWGTISHLIIVSAGPTILSIPMLFVQVGYVVALIGTLMSIFLYGYSMHVLLWCEYQVCKSKRIPKLSYSDLIYYSFKDASQSLRWLAKSGRYIISVVFIIIWGSACCYNLALAAENIQLVHNSWTKHHADVHVAMCWIVVPLLVLSWVRRLYYLVPVSIIAILANMICIVFVVYDVLFSPKSFKGAQAVSSIERLPAFLGTFLFMVNATGLILPLKNDTKNPRKFNGVFGLLTITYIPISLLYVLFGLLCSLKYGNDVKESVIENVKDDHSLGNYMVLMKALTLIFQYPLCNYVVFEVIWNDLMKERKKMWDNLILWEYVLKTLITLLVFSITYTLPSVKLFSILGGIIGTVIDSLLFPAFIQIAVMRKVSNNKKRFNRCLYKNILICIIAVVLLVTGGKACVQDIIWYYNQQKKG